MGVPADAAGLALADVWEHVISAVPDGWVARGPGLVGGVTLVGEPTLNGVWCYGLEAEVEAASTLLDRVATAGLPHCLQLRPMCRNALRDLCRARGMVRDTDIPLMVLDDPGGLLSGVLVEDLFIEVLPPTEAVVHAEVVAAGFGVPLEDVRRLVTPSVMGNSGVCCYVGERDGAPVATAVSVRLGAFVGIFNVATVPAQRRRGYGAAITARAVRDAFRSGAEWALLQSSQAGYRVYERLGFRALESWECWITRAVDDDSPNRVA